MAIINMNPQPEQLKPEEISRIDAALRLGKAQEQVKEEQIQHKDSSVVPTVPSVSLSDFQKFQEEMKQQMAGLVKASAEQIQSLQEQNVQLQTQLKQKEIQQSQTYFAAPGSIQAARLPEGLKIGQEVSFYNHAGGLEHGVIIGISIPQGVVSIEVHGRHENDVYKVHDVKFGDKLTRNSFTLDVPLAVTKKSPDRQHSKGLSVGLQS